MPKFTVEYNSSRPADEAFATVKKFLADGGEIKKFDAKAQVSFEDATKSCKIHGGQFKAEMNVAPAGTGSKVAVLVDLPLLLTPFKGKVQETLQKMLSKHLA
ncbi:MAG: polyhydroxyalkanoic acid system family protein [Bdellovibrionaceae bacterium]|nr:polyhydroxyalkanoic acid system family protein [Pseudobdellovibrionaceae bacterium]MBX3034381.1 polyhydroxyalkanoic acid system family protein [Pseudobdellovibrionaceae bacterium]